MKPAKIYQWREGVRISADPTAIGQQVERLSAGRGFGTVTPHDLVEAARKSNGELHDLFEWNDQTAAYQHRLARARYIIGALTINVSIAPEKPLTPIRAFVNIQDANDDRGYMALDRAMNDPQTRQQVVMRAWKELQEWKRRYSAYRDLADVCAAISVAEEARRLGRRQQAAAATAVTSSRKASGSRKR